jgi:hypothetical protein
VAHFSDGSCLDALLVALSGSPGPAAGTSDRTLCEGFIELRFRPLGGRAVCAALTVDDVLWVVIDLDKSNALGQAREMLEEWRKSHSS